MEVGGEEDREYRQDHGWHMLGQDGRNQQQKAEHGDVPFSILWPLLAE